MTDDAGGRVRAGGRVPACYRHPDRETYIRCTRCDRPICPDCMIAGPVGFQCPECVREGGSTPAGPRAPSLGGRLDRRGPLGHDGADRRSTSWSSSLQLALSRAVVNDLALIGWPASGRHRAGRRGRRRRVVPAGHRDVPARPGCSHIAVQHVRALRCSARRSRRSLGHGRFLVLYLLSALGGTAASYAFSGARHVVGRGVAGRSSGCSGAWSCWSASSCAATSRRCSSCSAINLVLGFVVPGIDWRGAPRRPGHRRRGGRGRWPTRRAAPRRTTWQVAGAVVVLAVVAVAGRRAGGPAQRAARLARRRCAAGATYAGTGCYPSVTTGRSPCATPSSSKRSAPRSARRAGGLAGVHPVDLSATSSTRWSTRTGLDPALVDDVIWGCVSQVGEQAVNVGRNAVLAAGWPESVPGVTLDRQCGSSQQALHFAAAGRDRRAVRRRGGRRRRVDVPGADAVHRRAGGRRCRSGRGCAPATTAATGQPGRRAPR